MNDDQSQSEEALEARLAAVRQDHADFDGALPLLSLTRRSVLGEWLSRMHPGPPWLAALGA